MRVFLKKGDVIIIVSILFISVLPVLGLLFQTGEGTVAVVIENGEVIDRIDLEEINDPYEMSINGGTLLIERGAISYAEGDCHDHCCIKMGRISKPGEIAACVPNKTCVYIEGKRGIDTGEGNVDAVTY